MNYTFGRGFSYGFKNNFGKFNFSTFNKSFNNKNAFKMFNSNLNSQTFKINFSNKYFMTKAVFLANNPNLLNNAGLGSKMLVGEVKNGMELDNLDSDITTLSSGDGMTQVSGLFLVGRGKIFIIL